MIKTEDLKVVVNEFGYNPAKSVLANYISASDISLKNDNIQDLFRDAEDGRIFINIAEFLSENNAELSFVDSEDLSELFNNIGEKAHEASGITFWRSNSIFRNLRQILVSSLLDFSSKKARNNKFLGSLSGQRITKILNTAFDLNMLTAYEEFKDCGYTDEVILKFVSFVKNKFIGGEIASLISSTGFKSLEPYTLVLSINPIDFYTMSLGTSWGSCMEPGGDYDSGSLPYATGPDTMIAYLVSNEKGEDLKSSPSNWEHKTWRQITYLTKEGFIIGQRPYPGDRKNVEYGIASFINKQLGLGLDISAEGAHDEENFFINNTGIETGYIDFLHGNNLTTIFGDLGKLEKRFSYKEGYELNIHAQRTAFCFECGSETSYLIEHGCTCEDCGDIDFCPCEFCRDRFHADCEGVYVEGYGSVCDNCLNSDSFVYSEFKSEFIHKEDALQAIVKPFLSDNLEFDYIPNWIVEDSERWILVDDLENKEALLADFPKFKKYDLRGVYTNIFRTLEVDGEIKPLYQHQ